jgi:hypothetical protein
MLILYLADSTTSLLKPNKSLNIAREINRCFLRESYQK